MKNWWEKDVLEYTEKDIEGFIENHVSGYTHKVWTTKELRAKLKRLEESDESIHEMFNHRIIRNDLERQALEKALKIRTNRRKKK